MEAYEPTQNNTQSGSSQGSQCSGTVWWANKRSGMEMDIPIISQPEVVLFTATNAYDTFEEYFTDTLTEEIEDV